MALCYRSRDFSCCGLQAANIKKASATAPHKVLLIVFSPTTPCCHRVSANIAPLPRRGATILSAKAQAHGGHFPSPRLARLVRNLNRSSRPSHAFSYSAGGDAKASANPDQEFTRVLDTCTLQSWVIMGWTIESKIVPRSTSSMRASRSGAAREQV